MGDVVKHVALAAVLRAPAPLYVESHAGDGLYPLGSAGEWGEGMGRLWEAQGFTEGGPVERVQALLRRFSPPGAARPAVVPGSPLLARELGAREMVLFEIDPASAAVLRKSAGGKVLEEDGFAGALREARPGALVLIDPPYSAKPEWSQAARLASALPQECAVLLWYPIKAMTRPQAMLGELADLGAHGTAVEIVATPLRLRRDRLNGAGVVFLRPPEGALAALGADLPALAALLATRGESTARVFGF